MEYQFLDNKLNADLTNLIASFVGPKSTKYINQINNANHKTKTTLNNENNSLEILNTIASIRYESRYTDIEFHDAEVDALNIYENIQDDLMIYYYHFYVFNRNRCEENQIFYKRLKDYIISYD